MEKVKVLVLNKIDTPSETTMPECHWSDSSTRRLIDLYSRYREKVGMPNVKTLKQMWIIISQEITKEFSMNITPSNCENRWRVLERSYKRYVDSKNSSGWGARKNFQYANEMANVLGHYPEILLGSKDTDNVNDVDNLKDVSSVTAQSSYEFCNKKKDKPMPLMKDTEEETYLKQKAMKRKMCMIEEKMRLDRSYYQKKRLEIENEKLKVLERLGTIRNNLMKNANELLKEKNDLLKERNEILKNSKCSCMRKDDSIMIEEHYE